jgi:hypothetical protein
MAAYAPNVNAVGALLEKWTAIEYGVTFQSVGGLFSSGTTQEKFNAFAMAGSRRISPGLIPTPGSLIVSSM